MVNNQVQDPVAVTSSLPSTMFKGLGFVGLDWGLSPGHLLPHEHYPVFNVGLANRQWIGLYSGNPYPVPGDLEWGPKWTTETLAARPAWLDIDMTNYEIRAYSYYAAVSILFRWKKMLSPFIERWVQYLGDSLEVHGWPSMLLLLTPRTSGDSEDAAELKWESVYGRRVQCNILGTESPLGEPLGMTILPGRRLHDFRSSAAEVGGILLPWYSGWGAYTEPQMRFLADLLNEFPTKKFVQEAWDFALGSESFEGIQDHCDERDGEHSPLKTISNPSLADVLRLALGILTDISGYNPAYYPFVGPGWLLDTLALDLRSGRVACFPNEVSPGLPQRRHTRTQRERFAHWITGGCMPLSPEDWGTDPYTEISFPGPPVPDTDLRSRCEYGYTYRILDRSYGQSRLAARCAATLDQSDTQMEE